MEKIPGFAGGVSCVEMSRQISFQLVSDESQKIADKYKVILHHISCSFSVRVG